MKCPYCGYAQAEPPKCKKCYAAIESAKPVEKAKTDKSKSDKKGVK